MSRVFVFSTWPALRSRGRVTQPSSQAAKNEHYARARTLELSILNAVIRAKLRG